jgi:hypothetical protein
MLLYFSPRHASTSERYDLAILVVRTKATRVMLYSATPDSLYWNNVAERGSEKILIGPSCGASIS